MSDACGNLTGLAKDAPELENQLLYVAEKWLTLAITGEQLSSGADRLPRVICTQLGGYDGAIDDNFRRRLP